MDRSLQFKILDLNNLMDLIVITGIQRIPGNSDSHRLIINLPKFRNLGRSNLEQPVGQEDARWRSGGGPAKTQSAQWSVQEDRVGGEGMSSSFAVIYFHLFSLSQVESWCLL